MTALEVRTHRNLGNDAVECAKFLMERKLFNWVDSEMRELIEKVRLGKIPFKEAATRGKILFACYKCCRRGIPKLLEEA